MEARFDETANRFRLRLHAMRKSEILDLGPKRLGQREDLPDGFISVFHMTFVTRPARHCSFVLS